MRARAGLLPALAAGAALLMLAAPLAARVSIGTASSLEGDRVLYRERRVEDWCDGALVGARVEYLTPEGEVFATKTLRFDSGATTPEFTFVDYREEFREGAVTDAGTVELFSGAVDELERRRAELPDAPVIDAGFDNLIRRDDQGNRYVARIVFEHPGDGVTGKALGAG